MTYSAGGVVSPIARLPPQWPASERPATAKRTDVGKQEAASAKDGNGPAEWLVPEPHLDQQLVDFRRHTLYGMHALDRPAIHDSDMIARHDSACNRSARDSIYMLRMSESRSSAYAANGLSVPPQRNT